MSEFIGTFQFVLWPFLVMAAFASVVPAVGCALYIRNEIMLAIALPSLTGAALTLGVLVGIAPENHVALFAFSFIITFALVYWLGTFRLSEIRRQIVLASLFAGGSVIVHLLMSVSSDAHAHLGFLLTGELLSLDRTEFILSSCLCIFSLLVLFVFKNAVFSYCIDTEMMSLRTPHFQAFTFFYRLMVLFLISASVLFVGPLLTSALLIFPALLSDMGRNSIASFFITGVVLGLLGSMGGFLTGVAADIPPAYTASIAILVAGGVYRLGSALFTSGSDN